LAVTCMDGVSMACEACVILIEGGACGVLL
jgi:hypothetical protein